MDYCKDCFNNINNESELHICYNKNTLLIEISDLESEILSKTLKLNQLKNKLHYTEQQHIKCMPDLVNKVINMLPPIILSNFKNRKTILYFGYT